MSNKREYIEFHGAPYETQGVMRYLSSPQVQGGIAVAIIYAATEVFLRHQQVSKTDFSLVLGTNILAPVVSISIERSYFNHRLPIQKDTAIDTSGIPTGNPAASIILSDYYRKGTRRSIFEAAFISLCTAPFHVFSPPYIASLVITAMWYEWAHHKLETGQWHATTKPPVKENVKIKAPLYGKLFPERAKAIL